MASKRKSTEQAPPKTVQRTVATIPGCVERPTAAAEAITVTPLGLATIQHAAAEGLATSAIAHLLGVSTQTLANLRRRDERVGEAFSLGRALLDAEIHDILMGQARAGVTIAAIFLAKCRLGWRETGADEAKVPNIVINLPGALSEDDWQRRRAQAGATINVQGEQADGPEDVRRSLDVSR
jgi:hypothetical protein